MTKLFIETQSIYYKEVVESYINRTWHHQYYFSDRALSNMIDTIKIKLFEKNLTGFQNTPNIKYSK